MSPVILMTDPAHFDVSYAINPWMRPGEWSLDPAGRREAARLSWEALRSALQAAGAQVEVAAGALGWPDMVFPASRERPRRPPPARRRPARLPSAPPTKAARPRGARQDPGSIHRGASRD